MSLELSRVNHRKWSWADEPGWVGSLPLPYCKSNGWTKHSSSPILSPSGSGDWENAYNEHSSVVRINGTYNLFFHGWRENGLKVDPNDDPNQGFGLATASSPEGPYTKHASNPLLVCGATGAWDAEGISNLVVIYDKTAVKWKMWYRGRDTSIGTNYIGYATADAPEGPWTKYGSNPVWGGGGNGIGFGQNVVRFGNLFYMMYPPSAQTSIRVAISSDGIAWADWGQVLSVSAGWDATQVRYAALFLNMGVWYLFYTGLDSSNLKIGLASSFSGFRTFDKWPFNPVLSIGTGGQFNDNHVFAPWLLMVEDKFWMWYTGDDGSGVRKIGLASIP